MASNPVIWFEIYVQDMPRAKTFYESVFHAKLEKLNTPDTNVEMWGFPMVMDQVGASGALVKMDGVASGGNSTMVYFSCADCAVEAALVPKYGGKIYREKMSIGEYGFIALALDTEGNMIGLHSLQ
ncbi:MAG: VOC family protein [Chlorobiaceae bacterium]|nr:VOC family protein [Chlorobiaceae bacterium]